MLKNDDIGVTKKAGNVGLLPSNTSNFGGTVLENGGNKTEVSGEMRGKFSVAPFWRRALAFGIKGMAGIFAGIALLLAGMMVWRVRKDGPVRGQVCMYICVCVYVYGYVNVWTQYAGP